MNSVVSVTTVFIVLLVCVATPQQSHACTASSLPFDGSEYGIPYLKWLKANQCVIPAGPDGTFGTNETPCLNNAIDTWEDAWCKIAFDRNRGNITFTPSITTLGLTHITPLTTGYLDISVAYMEIKDGVVWTYACPTNDFDLETVILHELGHMIGFDNVTGCTKSQTVM